MLILTEAVASGPQPVLNEWVRGVAGAICALAGNRLPRPHRPPELTGGPRRRTGTGSGSASTVALLWVAAMLVLALIPVWLLAARTHPPTEEWLGYGFFDKRWLLASFLLATLGSMVVLAAVAQIVRAAQTAPASWGEWASEAFAFQGSPDRRGSARRGRRAGYGEPFWSRSRRSSSGPTSSGRPGTWP